MLMVGEENVVPSSGTLYGLPEKLPSIVSSALYIFPCSLGWNAMRVVRVPFKRSTPAPPPERMKCAESFPTTLILLMETSWATLVIRTGRDGLLVPTS
jgi:hypothetical protein